MLMRRRTSRRGLGAMWRIDSGGEAVDCDLWSNILNSVCWAGSQGTVSSGGLPVNAQGGGTSQVDYNNPVSSLVSGCQNDPMGCVESAVTSQTIANQAANLLGAQTGGANPAASSCSQSFFPGVCDWIVYAVAAAALVGAVLIGSRR